MDERARGCFKYGCAGCLVVVALVVGAIFVVGALQMAHQERDPEFVEEQAEHPLPAAPDRPAMPQVLPLPDGVVEALPAPGRIVLDVTTSRFTIRPGEPGEPIRLAADYDTARYVLQEELVEEDGTWTYRLDFRPRGGFGGIFFGGGRDAGANRLDLVVPRDRLLDLVGSVGIGETELDLSGIAVRRVDLEMGAGQHFVEFGEPLEVPAERIDVQSSVGSVELRSLGNASPAEVVVDHSIGELYVDLTGAWQRDATVDVDYRIGECRVRLPRTARTVIARSSVTIGEKAVDRTREEELPADAPTLTLSLSGSIGELRVDR